MKDRAIDEILKKKAPALRRVDSALLDRVSSAVQSCMQPVRPLPPSWLLAGGLILSCASVALAGAARAGFFGVEKLSEIQRAAIFSSLGIFIVLAALACVSAMIPGSRSRVSPEALLGAGSVALLAVFAILFHDYHTNHFVHAGVVCLVTGLVHAVPAAALCWAVLRRGFAVDSIAAGLAGGTLAGLAGVTLLELHCINFQALHILVWHTAVVPVAGIAGALLARSPRNRADSGSRTRAAGQ